jgi:hypothetical protein
VRLALQAFVLYQCTTSVVPKRLPKTLGFKPLPGLNLSQMLAEPVFDKEMVRRG